MTPWTLIEKRIKAVAEADFVTAVYNPKSHGRYWELYRLKELFLKYRDSDTPVGYVRQAGREEQKVTLTTLGSFDPEDVDMFTVVIIGNSQTYRFEEHMVTPRGYFGEETHEDTGIGQSIMIESFRTIERELADPDIPLGRKWPLLHAIHTTADFDMENIVKVDDGAVANIYEALSSGSVRTIITDVTMSASGIRKGALERLGVEVKCYLSDSRTADLAKNADITLDPSWYTSGSLGISGCPLCLRQCADGSYGTMHIDTLREGKTMWHHRGSSRFRACMREQAHGEALQEYS